MLDNPVDCRSGLFGRLLQLLILGRTLAEFSDSWTYVNESPYYRAVIQFKGGRVSDKAWYDERGMGDHPDSKFHRKGGTEETLKKRTTTP